VFNLLDPRLEMKFWDRIIPEPNSGCWLWTGRIDYNGYGKINREWAHRAVYSRLVAPITPGLSIDHICRTRPCVNPAHLEPVTPRENARRGLRGAMLTHCKNGHEFTPENTWMRPTGDGPHRVCRMCKRQRDSSRLSAGSHLLTLSFCIECGGLLSLKQMMRRSSRDGDALCSIRCLAAWRERTKRHALEVA
jgi:hypothetical protein